MCPILSYQNIATLTPVYNKVVKYSMHNANSTLGENVRYFLYKYN